MAWLDMVPTLQSGRVAWLSTRDVISLALGADRPPAHIKELEECVSDEAVARLARGLSEVRAPSQSVFCVHYRSISKKRMVETGGVQKKKI